MKIRCPGCQKQYTVKEGSPLTVRVTCTQCGEAFTLAQAVTEEEPSEAGAAAYLDSLTVALDAEEPRTERNAYDDLVAQVSPPARTPSPPGRPSSALVPIVATPVYDDAPVVHQTIIIGQTQTMKNAGLAAVLSFFWPGLGQFYNGQFLKGIVFLVLWAVIAPLCVMFGIGGLIGAVVGGAAVAGGEASGAGLLVLSVLLVIFCIAMWIWPITDAYRSAEHINRRNRQRMMQRGGYGRYL